MSILVVKLYLAGLFSVSFSFVIDNCVIFEYPFKSPIFDSPVFDSPFLESASLAAPALLTLPTARCTFNCFSRRIISLTVF